MKHALPLALPALRGVNKIVDELFEEERGTACERTYARCETYPLFNPRACRLDQLRSVREDELVEHSARLSRYFSTHTASALYETFEPAEARRILRRLEFHDTPKQASWLNMVEIEIGVMVAQCLDRRIPAMVMLVREVKAGERARNRDGARIKWLFTLDRAREKLGRAYLSVHPKRASCPAA